MLCAEGSRSRKWAETFRVCTSKQKDRRDERKSGQAGERLLFQPPQGGTMRIDERLMTPHMLNEIGEKAEDIFGGGD